MEKKQELARINFWEKIKNGFNKTGNGLKNGAREIKNGVLGKKAKLGIIIFLVAGGVITYIWVNVTYILEPVRSFVKKN